MITILADATDNNIDLPGFKSLGKLKRRCIYFIKANSAATFLTYKMHMIIMVVAFCTIIFA